MNKHNRRLSSETRSVEESGENSNKRKSHDGSTPHIRSKRNRYISIACNECKRRKIKCNGQAPCHRCGNLSLECLYAPNCCTSGFKDSEEFRMMNANIQSLQEQVDSLYSNLTELRNAQDGNGLLHHGHGSYHRHTSLAQSTPQSSYQNDTLPSQPRGKHLRFQGPTSSAFNFDVANSSLQTMGITEADMQDESNISYNETPFSSPRQRQPALASILTLPSKDPIWKLGKVEAVRLCRVYEEEIGIMFPMFEIEKVIERIHLLFKFAESATRNGLLDHSLPGSDSIDTDDVNIIKILLATTLTIEGSGESELGRMLFDSVREASQSTLWEPVEIKGLILLAIVAQYHFHSDDEVQAYRLVGLAARLSLEMGLHRREVITKTYPDKNEWSWALKVFWSIYVLDRRYSFGTGMPFAVQDEDIDPALPEPDNSSPYLNAMIVYSRISTKVWGSVANFEFSDSKVKKDNIGYLDYQTLQWQSSIPESLRYYPSMNSTDLDIPNRGQRRLQVLLYLRTNQMRIMIYRPVLHSATSIMENRDYAQSVVEVAKNSIGVLTRLNQTTDIYRLQQMCFNYFLVSALAVLFLAVSHAPVEFSRQVRDEFYMALDLVKGFSTKSYIAKRLWKTIKGLKEVGPKLGLISRQPLPDANDPHSSAAVAMAGLAGHPVDEMAVFNTNQSLSPLGDSPTCGQQLSHELTNLFEAAGGYGSLLTSNGQGADGTNGFVSTQGELSHISEGMSGVYGNDGEFSRIMRDLF